MGTTRTVAVLGVLALPFKTVIQGTLALRLYGTETPFVVSTRLWSEAGPFTAELKFNTVGENKTVGPPPVATPDTVKMTGICTRGLLAKGTEICTLPE